MGITSLEASPWILPGVTYPIARTETYPVPEGPRRRLGAAFRYDEGVAENPCAGSSARGVA